MQRLFDSNLVSARMFASSCLCKAYACFGISMCRLRLLLPILTKFSMHRMCPYLITPHAISRSPCVCRFASTCTYATRCHPRSSITHPLPTCPHPRHYASYFAVILDKGQLSQTCAGLKVCDARAAKFQRSKLIRGCCIYSADDTAADIECKIFEFNVLLQAGQVARPTSRI